jgi:putative ABC transport system permease protein
MFQNLFKTAWRSVLRNRVTTTIHMLGLTLGITVCLIIFLLLKFELGYDRFHKDGDRIYRVVSKSIDPGGEQTFGFVTMALPNAIRAEVSGFEQVAAFDDVYSTVKVPRKGGAPQVFEAARQGEGASPIVIAQPQYFAIFDYRWLAGNAATALNEPFSVVLTVSEAEK